MHRLPSAAALVAHPPHPTPPHPRSSSVKKVTLRLIETLVDKSEDADLVAAQVGRGSARLPPPTRKDHPFVVPPTLPGLSAEELSAAASQGPCILLKPWQLANLMCPLPSPPHPLRSTCPP